MNPHTLAASPESMVIHHWRMLLEQCFKTMFLKEKPSKCFDILSGLDCATRICLRKSFSRLPILERVADTRRQEIFKT